MSKEVWLPVPSVPELLVSSEGRVMREPYLSKLGTKKFGGKPWRGCWNDNGAGHGRYIYFFHQRHKTYRVARLVCEAFHGAAPKDKPVCMHLDENPRNNKPENLAWGTHSENCSTPRERARRRAHANSRARNSEGRAYWL